ncbi:phytoene desaturase family protein [Carboxylicivirga marina]|uniref:NAD(P)/FAD-dependent oxidoreductase n=1 Tax=Carboxylicivirga marina TaxID=2800988 RepID=A0ABS1HE13_9BACT|nr:NAD(P)/FAD-dependent oxidoreductase [Carboxylicivirga marina]MBK3515730.1 NAD(P)/FAD-dependent oxidoreductase [Carboxylicivirga marina]
MTQNRYDSIVVGGGIAGLTSATYLARAGQKVLLIEKNKEVGGLVNTFSRDGFQFEAGVRALEDAGIIFPMLKELGIELDFVRSPVSVGVENEIINIKDINSLKDYQQMLIRLFPDNEDEIDNLMVIIRKIMKHMEVLYGLENPAFKDLKNDTNYLFKQLLPWLPKFLFTMGKINRMNMPVEDYLKNILTNASLRDVVAQHFFKNTPTFFALSYFALYLDYFYPIGGVGKLAEAMHAKFHEYGGVLLTQTSVISIDAGANEITDNTGACHTYQNMVWAADLKTFYQQTITKQLTPKIALAFEKQKKPILESRGGDSVFSLYLQIDEPLDSFCKIAHGHFFYTPSKEGLGETHWGELKTMLKCWTKTSKQDVYKWLDKFTALNTYEISIPGLKDKSLVPTGKTGMIISILADYDLFEQIKEDGWYDEFKKELEDRMIQVLSNSIYPMLANKVMKQFSFTPLGIKERVGSSEGAITGWSFQETIPVMHKIQYSDRSTLTPIPNIFQAGQWCFSPAGVPMSILTGRLAADKVIKNTRRKGTVNQTKEDARK